jgi:hypothetical protein
MRFARASVMWRNLFIERARVSAMGQTGARPSSAMMIKITNIRPMTPEGP